MGRHRSRSSARAFVSWEVEDAGNAMMEKVAVGYLQDSRSSGAVAPAAADVADSGRRGSAVAKMQDDTNTARYGETGCPYQVSLPAVGSSRDSGAFLA